MKLKYAGTKVNYETAKKRAMARLTTQPTAASMLAVYIWPDNKMSGQGAGGAASRILKRMEAEGLCHYVIRGMSWGWVSSLPNRAERTAPLREPSKRKGESLC